MMREANGRAVVMKRSATGLTRRDGCGRAQIISDYVPKAARGPTRAATLALSVATAIGLFKLNTQGEGITRSVKSLWKA